MARAMRSRLTPSGMSHRLSGSWSRQRGFSMSGAIRPGAQFCATRPRRASSASFRLPKASLMWRELRALSTGSSPILIAFSARPRGRIRHRLIVSGEKWCPGAGSNHRHCDFQSHALPTELPGRRPERCPGRAPVYSEARLPCPATGGFSRSQIRRIAIPQNPPDSRTSASPRTVRPVYLGSSASSSSSLSRAGMA